MRDKGGKMGDGNGYLEEVGGEVEVVGVGVGVASVTVFVT